ncbi:MAG: class I SAM-dependent methyltransferase [Planctomycetes bacterium]|nr:class I SAM-dependent methyltransferase [Planctomycetota bacterium]
MIEIKHGLAPCPQTAYERFYAARTTEHELDYYLWLLRLLGLRAGERLLDVGCGEGALVRAVRARQVAAWGVDVARKALESAGGASGGDRAVVQADGERLPFPDRCFDVVTSVGSLEHYADPERGAGELARVLVPGGRALVLVPNTFGLLWTVKHALRTGEIFDDGQPIQRYGTRGEWERLLVRQGLRVARVVGFDVPVRPQRVRSWLGLLVRPRTLGLTLIGRFLIPVNLASCLVYLCRREGGAG